MYPWTCNLTAKLLPGPLAIELRALSSRPRAARLDLVLDVGLPLLLRDGPARGGGKTPGHAVRLKLTTARFGQVCAVSDALGVPPAVVIREVIRAADTVSGRTQLEIEYCRRGLPGDPSRLSDTVLRLFVVHDIEPFDPVSIALRELSSELTRVSSELQIVKTLVQDPKNTRDAKRLLALGREGLRHELRRLGGRVPSRASKGELLSLIREQERKVDRCD